jgi:hypothetical protein
VEIHVLDITQERWKYLSSTKHREVEIPVLYLTQVRWRYLSST